MNVIAKWFVPGRIEVLGKHTDYAGGRSLLCAVERGFTVMIAPHDVDKPQVDVVGAGWSHHLSLSPDLEEEPGLGSLNYTLTAVRRFARDFPFARRTGVISLDTDLPYAAGMSSSSALIISVFLGLAELNALRGDAAAAGIFESPESLAGYLAAVESGSAFEQYGGDRGVGTSGGSEDHTAILCCTAGALSQYAFCPVRHESTVPLDTGWTFAIAVSGAWANKTGAARDLYNNAARAVEQILGVWREATGRDDRVLAHALDSGPDAGERLRQCLSSAGRDDLQARLDQFIEETHMIVPSAAAELAAGNLLAFGALVDRSQWLAEHALGNQVPETIHLARSARMGGAAAASAFGAGFGGSVWALVRSEDAPRFLERWRDAYASAFPGRAHAAAFFTTRPGPAAHRIE